MLLELPVEQPLQLAGELSSNLSPLAILGGESVADVAGRLLERLPLGPSPQAAGVSATVSSLLALADADVDVDAS